MRTWKLPPSVIRPRTARARRGGMAERRSLTLMPRARQLICAVKLPRLSGIGLGRMETRRMWAMRIGAPRRGGSDTQDGALSVELGKTQRDDRLRCQRGGDPTVTCTTSPRKQSKAEVPWEQCVAHYVSEVPLPTQEPSLTVQAPPLRFHFRGIPPLLTRIARPPKPRGLIMGAMIIWHMINCMSCAGDGDSSQKTRGRS